MDFFVNRLRSYVTNVVELSVANSRDSIGKKINVMVSFSHIQQHKKHKVIIYLFTSHTSAVLLTEHAQKLARAL